MAQLLGTVYKSSGTCGSHLSSDWQIARDSLFTDILFQDLDDLDDLTSKVASLNIGIDGGIDDTLIFARVRYKSNTCLSEWSEVRACSVGNPPAGDIRAPIVYVPGTPSGISTGPQLSADGFYVDLDATGFGDDVHISTDWIIKESGSNNIVWSSIKNTIGKKTIKVPLGTLRIGQSYDIYVRFNGSYYTGLETIVTGTVINENVIMSPSLSIEGKPNNVPSGPTLTASNYENTNPADGHYTTDWEILDTGDNVVWFDHDSRELQHIKVPFGTLTYGTTYKFRVRFKSVSVLYSEWYEEIATCDYSDNWVQAVTLPHRLTEHGQSLIDNNRILVTGGLLDSDDDGVSEVSPTNITYIIDIDNTTNYGVVTEGFLLNHPRAAHCQIYDADNSMLYIIGGKDALMDYVSTIHIYDMVNEVWSAGPALPVPMGYAKATLYNGSIFITGGVTTGDSILNKTLVYDLSSGTITEMAVMTVGLYGHAQSITADNTLLISGGINTTEYSGKFYEYDIGLNTWSDLTAADALHSIIPRAFHTQELLNNGNILIMGGILADGTIVPDTLEYVKIMSPPILDKLDMPVSKYKHSSCKLNNGSILTIAGSSTVTLDTLNTGHYYI